MNTISLNYLITSQQYSPAFCAKIKTPKIKLPELKTLTSDVVELTTKQGEGLPRKFEFTELETRYNEVWHEFLTVQSNAHNQKQNLRYYYSAQDKYDYQELLKQKQKLSSRLKRIAKSANQDQYELEYNIDIKKSYNRWAPKILNAKSHEALNNLQNEITSRVFPKKCRELLNCLIEQQKISLQK